MRNGGLRSRATAIAAVLATTVVLIAVGCQSPPPSLGPNRVARTEPPRSMSWNGLRRLATRSTSTTTAPNRSEPAGPVAETPSAEDLPGQLRTGYEVTVYYTAVESFHTDAPVTVTGCLVRECARGRSMLGSYPASFVTAVRNEGTGRITSGAQAGRYLNWSWDVGYWLDDVAVDSFGGRLVPFSSAAGDGMARGLRFRLQAPLVDDEGVTLDPSAAARLLAATWTISDEFTPGLGGSRHVDLYIGEEDRASFETTSPLYTTFHDSSLLVM